METYLTIEELAEHLKLAAQTIRRWVLNREIPYHKIKKAIRFRLSEIERWIDTDGKSRRTMNVETPEGDLFAEEEAGEERGCDGEDDADPETMETGGET